jgi:hypothetical protein
VLKRIGLGKLSRLEPPEPPNRYERRRAGELLHIDVKKLGRIIRPGHRVTGSRLDRRDQGKKGREFVHVCVDDATRLAYVEVLADEKATTAAAFLRRAVAFYRQHGIQVERVMSDNGACYRSKLHAVYCRMPRPAPPAHPPLPAPHQREGRALHPDPARRLGLRHLRHKRTTHRRP